MDTVGDVMSIKNEACEFITIINYRAYLTQDYTQSNQNMLLLLVARSACPLLIEQLLHPALRKAMIEFTLSLLRELHDLERWRGRETVIPINHNLTVVNSSIIPEPHHRPLVALHTAVVRCAEDCQRPTVVPPLIPLILAFM